MYQIIDEHHEHYGKMVEVQYMTEDQRFSCVVRGETELVFTHARESQLEKIERWKP